MLPQSALLAREVSAGAGKSALQRLLRGDAGTRRAVWESREHLYGLQPVLREAWGGRPGCALRAKTDRSTYAISTKGTR